MKKVYLTSLLFVCSLIIYSQKTPSNILNVTQSGNNLIVTFNLPSYSVKDTSLQELYGIPEIFKFIDLDSFGNIDDIGYPRLPQLTVDLAIPEGACDLKVTVSHQVTQDLSINKRFLPTQEDYKSSLDFQINSSYYSSNGEAYDFLSQVSDPYMVFGEMGVGFSIFPFTYNPKLNTIKVLKQATFVISYSNTTIKSTQPSYSSEIKNSYLSGFFENYSPQKLKSGTDFKGRYLMITDSKYESTLKYFANYKRNIGYEVTVVNTNTTGTSSREIKDYIQKRYDNSSTRPDFVLLVGDHNDIPASGGNPSGNDINDPITDLHYARLSGTYWTIKGRRDDYYADVLIGRFSVSKGTELQNIINKSVYMEMNIHLFDKKAKFIAGADKNQFIENQFEKGHKEVIRNTFGPEGYSCEKLYQPNITQAVHALSDNPLYYIYSGHGSEDKMSGGSFYMTGSHILSATNTVFPFVFSFACKTGNFAYLSSPSIGEHWIRANNKGGVSYFGSSVNTMLNSDKAIEKKIFGDAFTDNEHIAGITNLGMRRYWKRLWSFANPKRTKRYMKAYNLLGDPSFNVLGVGCMYNYIFSQNEVFNNGDKIKYHASNGIKNQAGFEIRSGASVTLLSGNSITLNSGVHIRNGAFFRAKIKACNNGRTLKSTKVSNNENHEFNYNESDVLQSRRQIAGPSILKIFPNPASSEVSVSYMLDKDSFVKIELYNLSGMKIKTLLDRDKQNKGDYDFNFSISELAPGTYLFVFTSSSSVTTYKIIKN